MAILFSLEPDQNAWAFNHQYFRFTSDLFLGSNIASSLVTISEVGGSEIITLSLFPNPDGFFVLDVLGVLRSVFDNREDDSLTYNVGAVPTAAKLYKNLLFEFQVLFDNGASADTANKTVNFVKGFAEVNERVGIPAPASDSKLDERSVLMSDLSYYWEGYPFEYSFFDDTDDTIKRNIISDGVPSAISVDEGGFRRIVDEKTGIYLKWFNSRGGYSYWRFSCITQQKIQSDSTGRYQKPFLTSSPPKRNESHDLNREIFHSINVNSVFSLDEQQLLTSLLNSNEVYMFDASKGTEVNSSDEYFRRIILSKNEVEFNTKNQQFEVALELTSFSRFDLTKLIKENKLIFITLVDGIDGQTFPGFYVKNEDENSLEAIGVRAGIFTGVDTVQTLDVNGTEFEIETTTLEY